MTATKVQSDVMVEVYPVIQENLPTLTAWEMNVPGEKLAEIGQKLAHRLRLRQGSVWVWSQNRLITDATIQQPELSSFIEELWASDHEVFKQIQAIEIDMDFRPQTETLANFVAFGVMLSLEKKIAEYLRKYNTTIRNAIVERDYDIQGWSVDGKPAISITVKSHIMAAMTLRDYFAKRVQSAEDLIGLMVRDRFGNLRGEIKAISGTLSDLRDELLKKTSRESMRNFTKQAPDNDLVVKIKTRLGNHDYYDYPASALRLIASGAQYDALGIDGQEALKVLQIPPKPRYEMVRGIAEMFVELGYISAEPYNSTNSHQHFGVGLDASLGIKARLGNNTICDCSPLTVLNTLKRAPVYKRSPLLPSGKHLKLAVLNLIGDNPAIKNYLSELRKHLMSIGFPVEFAKEAERPSRNSRKEIAEAIERHRERNPHIVLTFLPGHPGDGELHSDLYIELKSQMLREGLQSQAIYEGTLNIEYALHNIVLGILLKTGNVPYVMDKPLPYTDLVVGIDIARQANERSKGSRNVAAMTRIYTANGDFLKFSIIDTGIEGETLSIKDIRQLFPARDFKDKRCIVHRDGLFRGNERADLRTWAQEIGATFYLVEVIKSNVPRLYKRELNSILRPDKGSVFIVNEYEAFLVSTPPPHKNSTPRPLLVRTDEFLPIKNAIHSILALTHMHAGSILMPRLPVTLHYSDQIGYLVLRGIRPNGNEGNIPFWI